MGQTVSTSSALQSCLSIACAGTSNCVGYPTDLLYQADWVKPYNLAFDVVPAAVLRPSSAQQVAAMVQCAVANNLSVQARSGGHSFANYGLGGSSGALALDLANLNQFSMNTDTWQATIGPGARLGNVTELLVDNGDRAFAHGVCPGVGLGGHATIGGLGPMSRMWGSCLDHIVEVEVVTANGSIVRASETANSDLFFALRGAGAGFGIITEFVMRTHPAPGSVVQYTFDMKFGSAASMASTFETWQALIGDPDLDRRFGSEFILHALGAVITGTFYDTETEWLASGIPDRLPQQKGDNTTSTVVVQGWLGSLTQEAENEALYLADTPSAFYSKSLALTRPDLLNSSAIADLFAYIDAADKGTLLWFIIFDATGGAIADVPSNATAYAHRDAVLYYQSYAVNLLKLSTTTTSFLSGFHEELLRNLPYPDSAEYYDDGDDNENAHGTYPGYVDPNLTNPQKSYWRSNLPALELIKARWDPSNIFQNPQSVQPAIVA